MIDRYNINGQMIYFIFSEMVTVYQKRNSYCCAKDIRSLITKQYIFLYYTFTN